MTKQEFGQWSRDKRAEAGLSPVARAAGLPHRRLGARPVFEVLAATCGVYAALLGTGWMVLGSPAVGGAAIAAAILLLAWVVQSKPGAEPTEE